jgi:ribonuclease HII
VIVFRESMPRSSRPFSPEHAARYPAVVGVDEVGRGALCGPVMTAAAWFDPVALPPDLLAQLDDSKRLRADHRERIAAELRRHARYMLRAASPRFIDAIGIRHATLDAMRRAVLALGIRATVVVDGRDLPPGLPLPARAVVRADCTVPQCAAASILAKVVRDALMRRLAVRYPAYRWETNVGYGTREHLEALARDGATRHHRRSFAPVTQLPLQFKDRPA